MKFARLVNNRLVDISSAKKQNLKQVIDNATEYDSETQKLTSQYFEEDENYIYRKFHVQDRVIIEPESQVMLDSLTTHITETFTLYAKHLHNDAPRGRGIALQIRSFLKTFNEKIRDSYKEFKQKDYKALDFALSYLDRSCFKVGDDLEIQQPEAECISLMQQSDKKDSVEYVQTIIDFGNDKMSEMESQNGR